MLAVEGDRGTIWSPARSAPSEPIVISRRDAFAALMERQLDSAYRLAAVILGDAGEAEDAVHDAAVAAWRSRELLREDARFEAWFTRIVVNVCRDRLRAKSRHRVVQLPADFAETARNHDRSDVLAALSSRDSIGRGFAVLEPDEQIVLVLRSGVTSPWTRSQSGPGSRAGPSSRGSTTRSGGCGQRLPSTR